MKKSSLLLIAFAALLFSSFTIIAAIQWQPKDGYNISFSSDKASGLIGGLKGIIDFDKNDITNSKFDVTVDVNTLNTGNWLKNQHAKADDFFDVAHYPTIRFASSKLVKSGNEYLVSGNLSIKNVTKHVAIPFVFSGTGDEGKFIGFFTINRNDYNLIKNGIGDSVKIGLTIPVIKK